MISVQLLALTAGQSEELLYPLQFCNLGHTFDLTGHRGLEEEVEREIGLEWETKTFVEQQQSVHGGKNS